MDAEAYLASIGIKPVIGYSGAEPISPEIPPHMQPACDHHPYPTALVTTVSSFATLSTFTIAYFAFKFRHMISKFARNHFDYLLSNRPDLVHEITYSFYVGQERLNFVTIPLTGVLEIASGPNSEPVVMEPAGDEIELAEVISE